MATPSRLTVTDLDFDTIKTNLKTFLNQQSEFSDYNFEGSTLSVLIDLLAYNTHYNAYYLNMIANESFLDTALLRDSVISHAKLLGYTPSSKNAAIAYINITIETNDSTVDTLTMPRGTKFTSEIIGDFPYNFVTVENYTVTKSGTKYIFNNIPIYEGIFNTYSFIQDNGANPNQIFTLPDQNVDTRTIKVTIKDNPSNSSSEVYTRSTDILDLNSTSNAFYLQEGRDLRYQIYFGDDFISKKLPDGAQIIVTYLVTNGSVANRASSFLNLTSISGYTNVVISTVTAAIGGSERESVDSIKFSAPQAYSTQNRLVTTKDYASFIKLSYPGIQSISVWGGEEQTPKVFNKVFISIKMKEGFFLSENEKTRILNSIIKPKAIVTTDAEILEPDYTYILVNGRVKYDSTKTNLSSNDLKNVIRNSIISYNNTNLETFNSRYVQSRLQDDIDNSDPSIVGSVIETKIKKKVPIFINELKTYIIDFGSELRRGSLQDKLVSEYFDIFDFQGTRRTIRFEEIPYSSTGIESIEILNSGINYRNVPTVTITGDGTGAKATAILLNGRVTEIVIDNPGINYTSATVTINGDGTSASAIAIVQGKKGYLRAVYYNENSEAKIIEEYAGTINYETGLIQTNEYKILSVYGEPESLSFVAFAKETIIDSKRNTIVLIDSLDAESISIALQPL